MRSRDRILASLESVYRTAFEEAQASGDTQRMARLDFEYQQEQLRMEVLLDIRSLLQPPVEPGDVAERDPLDTATSLLEKADKIRRITRFAR